jgi:hypothetical protein
MTKSSDVVNSGQPLAKHPASLTETELLVHCKARRQRRSGPGGQHRNKVETAVVITHVPTGLKGEASERRSQEENRQRALFRLRVNLALGVRTSVNLEGYVPSEVWASRCGDGRISVSSEHADFPTILAEALNVLAASQMDAKAASQALQCSSSQLIKLLQQEPKAFAIVNDLRRIHGLKPYQ